MVSSMPRSSFHFSLCFAEPEGRCGSASTGIADEGARFLSGTAGRREAKGGREERARRLEGRLYDTKEATEKAPCGYSSDDGDGIGARAKVSKSIRRGEDNRAEIQLGEAATTVPYQMEGAVLCLHLKWSKFAVGGGRLNPAPLSFLCPTFLHRFDRQDCGFDDCTWESSEVLLREIPGLVLRFETAHPEHPIEVSPPEDIESMKQVRILRVQYPSFVALSVSATLVHRSLSK